MNSYYIYNDYGFHIFFIGPLRPGRPPLRPPLALQKACPAFGRDAF